MSKKDEALEIKEAMDELNAEKLRQERREITGEMNLQQLRDASHTQIPALFAAITIAAVLPLLLWTFLFDQQYTETLLSFSLIATPLVTFFGFIWIGEFLKELEPSLGVLRTALTASIASEYFVLLALTIFLAGEANQFPLQQQLVNSFTAIAGVVFAFYFGGAAYNQGKK